MSSLTEQDMHDVVAMQAVARQRSGVPALQHEILAAAERYMGATSSCFFVRSENHWVHDFDRVAYRGLPDGWAKLYVERLAADDPLAPYIRDNKSWRFGVITLEQLVSSERWASCRLFRDLFGPVGIRHMMGIELTAEGEQIGLLGLFRSERAGGFSTRDVNKAGLTSTAIALALRRGLDAERTHCMHHRLGDAFAMLAGVQFIILDQDLRVAYASPSATALVCAPSRMETRRGSGSHLAGPLRAMTLTFKRRVASSGADERPSLEIAERIRDDASGKELEVNIRFVDALIGAGGCYVLCIRERAPAPCSIARLLELGLTAREAQIAALVAGGLRNIDIAQQLRISVNTVQTHLRSIFAKLGIKNRVGLVSRTLVDRTGGPAGRH